MKEEKEGRRTHTEQMENSRARQGTRTEQVPLVELSAELWKGSARVKRSGRSREVSGDFSPSISFSVSEPEREDGER